MMEKNKDSEENRKFWDYVEKTSAEVEQWPAWKIGGPANMTISEYRKQQKEHNQKP